MARSSITGSTPRRAIPRGTLAELGIPAWDIVHGRSDRGAIALELTGDRPSLFIDHEESAR
jgi:hypothetical protein